MDSDYPSKGCPPSYAGERKQVMSHGVPIRKIHAKVIAGNRYRCDRFACRWAQLCGAGSLTRPRRATLGYWVSTETVEQRSTGQPGGSCPYLGCDCGSIAPGG